MNHLDETSEWCPCTHHQRPRRLNDGDIDNGETWEVVYTCVVLLFMFAALISDRIGADGVMLAALTLFMAAEIVSVSEGLKGFANEGLLTVLALFVVAEGIGRTGALDWYLGKMLGTPTTTASAQLRLMIPISIVSAFLNNTPVVAVMIPIVQRWAKNCRISAQQLLIPLSFASILGGTCTLIGTSTNLVVVGLLNERYQNELSIGLFDLGQYGVPVTICGMLYVLVASPFLLPGGKSTRLPGETADDILLGARLLPWSPAAGRTVKRSGLRDTGGIFLVSVHRAATGNVHRAVSNDFVLNAGDILYFTGLVESFGEFCEENGLEVVTNEIEEAHNTSPQSIVDPTEPTVPTLLDVSNPLLPVSEQQDESESNPAPINEVGVTKESLLQADEDERMRNVVRMTDMIRGYKATEDAPWPKRLAPGDPAKIVVTVDRHLVVVGIDAPDRPGLLLDISKGLVRLNMQLHHTEASVIGNRSLSIWRCESGTNLPDLEEIWSVLSALLSTESGVEAIKKRGLRVIRVMITKSSNLAGKAAQDVDFRGMYRAAIVAIQKGSKNITKGLSSIRLDPGDILVLQVSDDSPLLESPPDDFYKNLEADETSSRRTSSVKNLVNMIARKKSSTELSLGEPSTPGRRATQDEADNFQIGGYESDDRVDDDEERIMNLTESLREIQRTNTENVWKDLLVLKKQEAKDVRSKEFLTAMEVAKASQLVGKSVIQAGIHKLPDLHLVSIDRPTGDTMDANSRTVAVRVAPDMTSSLSLDGSVRTESQVFRSIAPEEALQEGDVLWFAGSASAVGDLRKIPGLVSYQNDEVEKINEKVHDRRLVQAVIARKGPLVGKTVKETRFRTRYGAAVIAVHREGRRVHEHPGRIKLQAGDVLLLEAGPNFLARASDNNRSFALLSEVENSAPPRLTLLIPALVIAAGMLIVFTAGLTSLLVAALVASMLMVGLGILSEQEARDAVNWEVFITIGSAFGIGTALVNSGVAEAIANFLVDVGTAIGIGDAGLMGAVYFATFLISNVVTNNAAAALLFPIAMDAAEQTGADRILMSYALMLGASASFMSPFGYTTNLLIYGPGGYKYMDFVVFGTPMQVVLWILSTAFLSVIEPWYVSWISSSVLFIVTSVFLLGTGSFWGKKRPARTNSTTNPVEHSASR